MIWPPQSPDCKPIELLCDHLDREVRKTPPRCKNDLWEAITNIWKNIDEEYFKKFINRMPRICQAIVKAKGGHFDKKMI